MGEAKRRKAIANDAADRAYEEFGSGEAGGAFTDCLADSKSTTWSRRADAPETNPSRVLKPNESSRKRRRYARTPKAIRVEEKRRAEAEAGKALEENHDHHGSAGPLP